MVTPNEVKKLIESQFEQLVIDRRTLHSHPERGFKEFFTADYIVQELNKLANISYRRVQTGIIAEITGNAKGSNHCIGFRGDIDGLEVNDLKDVSYKSLNPGMCHACGHDAHATMLLGLARNMNSLVEDFSGTVKFFFQPAEETDGGALPLIRAGCLENPYVESVIGIHVSPGYKTGMVRFCYGTMQASSTEVEIVVNGKGAHAAHPETGVDGIVVASQIVLALQTIVSRSVSPLDSAALSIGMISGGTAPNALAQSVKLVGTIRTLNEAMTQHVRKRIEEVVEGITLANKTNGIVTFTPSYIPLINNTSTNDEVRSCAVELLREENVIVNNVPSLGVEDFAYFAGERPSCFYNLGTSGSPETSFPGHNGYFDIDEESLKVGINLNTLYAIRFLSKD